MYVSSIYIYIQAFQSKSAAGCWIRATRPGYFTSADTEFQAWAALDHGEQSYGACYFSLIPCTQKQFKCLDIYPYDLCALRLGIIECVNLFSRVCWLSLACVLLGVILYKRHVLLICKGVWKKNF